MGETHVCPTRVWRMNTLAMTKRIASYLMTGMQSVIMMCVPIVITTMSFALKNQLDPSVVNSIRVLKKGARDLNIVT
jgi:hypothetical protein